MIFFLSNLAIVLLLTKIESQLKVRYELIESYWRNEMNCTSLELVGGAKILNPLISISVVRNIIYHAHMTQIYSASTYSNYELFRW